MEEEFNPEINRCVISFGEDNVVRNATNDIKSRCNISYNATTNHNLLKKLEGDLYIVCHYSFIGDEAYKKEEFARYLLQYKKYNWTIYLVSCYGANEPGDMEIETTSGKILKDILGSIVFCCNDIVKVINGKVIIEQSKWIKISN